MKPTSLSFSAIAVLALSVVAASALAQAPQGAPAQQPPPGGPPRSFPAPTNLKVLPSTSTGQQVHDVMELWEGSLGAHCNSCHAVDPTRTRPDGRPMLNFADDSKPEKATARQMFRMTEEINRNYISKIDSSGAPVTCGTCHRGHLGPEPYVIPPEEPHGPPPPGAPGGPPAGATPPAAK